MIIAALSILYSVLACITALFALEVGAGLLTGSNSRRGISPRLRTSTAALLIPAHNEAEAIAETVENARRQLRSGDRILVIADNCSDETAELARSAGAEVVVRVDDEKKGKGFALEAGLTAVTERDAPTVIVVLDADCMFSPGSLDALVDSAASMQVPVQAFYRMGQSRSDDPGVRVAEFAWRIRAELRPSGLSCLGLPCQLMGTGMALPWALIRRSDLGGSHITEDLKLGVALALAGRAPRFCRDATVTSSLPPTENGRRQQRRRWIHGHLSVIAEDVPRLLGRTLQYGDPQALAMAMDLAILPLTGFAILHVLGAIVAGGIFLTSGSSAPLAISVVGCVLFFGSVGAAWIMRGRDLIGWRELSGIARHMAQVVIVLIQFVTGNRSEWVRSQR